MTLRRLPLFSRSLRASVFFVAPALVLAVGCGEPTFHPADRVDADGDGFYAVEDPAALLQQLADEERFITELIELKLDCNDGSDDIFPGAAELCDGLDNDCDSSLDPSERDDDGDGYTECGWSAEQNAVIAEDCNDDPSNGAYQNPSRTEVCAHLPVEGVPLVGYELTRPTEGVDDNCDGSLEEGEFDRDQDGHFSGCYAVDLTGELNNENGRIADYTDCADNNPEVNPSVADEEVECFLDSSGDRNPTNCNPSSISVGFFIVWFPDLDQDGDGDLDGGSETQSDPGQWEFLCQGETPPGFNGSDTNPNWLQSTGYDEVSSDWAGNHSDCNDNPLANGSQQNGLNADGDSASSCAGDVYPNGQTADNEASAYPGATESCDAIDNDLDGTTDEDFDGDGDGSYTTGTTPDGCESVYGTTAGGDGVDCDDGDPTRNTVDVDGDDSTTCATVPDCNDADPSVTGLDYDGDGDGSCDTPPDCDDSDASLNLANADSDAYTTCDGDCDDTNPAVFPGAAVVCDSVLDNNCDNNPDPNQADVDGDGFSVCAGDCNDNDSSLNLTNADGDPYSTCDGDCDDNDDSRYPGAPLVCDGVPDNDCNGVVDPNQADADGDEVTICEGDCNDNDASVENIDADQDTVSTCEGDCDDDNDQLSPEVDADGDGWDTCGGFGYPADCDDNDAAENWNDADGDGSSTCPDGNGDTDCNDQDETANLQDLDGDLTTTCGPDGIANSGDEDCDDSNAAIEPGNSDNTHDGLDNDCDGTADEGAIAAGDLAVVEMMISTDTSTVGGDGNGEYIEVYNTTGTALDLRGWTVVITTTSTGATTSFSFPATTATSPVLVPSATRIVLARSNNEDAYGTNVADYFWSPGLLPDDGGTIDISFNSVLIDTVTWLGSSSFAWDPGSAMGLQAGQVDGSAASSNNSSGNWCTETGALSSGNAGSPGTAGSFSSCGP